MKATFFLIFFSIVLTVYGLVNTYIFVRGLQAIPLASPVRAWYIVGFWSIAATFVLARILERAYPCGFTEVITWIGSFWLAFMLYFILALVMIDLARLINHFIPFFPEFFYADYQKTKMVALITVTGLVTMVVAGGFINARIPKIREMDITVRKALPGIRELKVVMASDIHLGTIIAKRKANRLVETINGLDPDLVLFAGDVVDEDLAPVIRRDLGTNLTRIRAKYGVYAITGNHEYIGGAEAAVQYLWDHGLTMLRDTAVYIEPGLYLVGREDRDRPRFSGKERKELAEIMSGIDRTKPVILLDHQPFHLEQAEEQGADLQLSGHTHHGQLWPFNYITLAMYEVSSGYKKKGNTHVYVSPGFGTWGPPVRIGNRPEIVLIRIHFTP